MENEAENVLIYLDWQPSWELLEDKINEVLTRSTDSSGELVAITVQ